MKRSRKRLVWIALIAVVGVGVALAMNARGKETAGPKLETPLGKAALGNVQVEVTEVGTVEPEVKVDVKSVLSGKVVELPIREGDVVKKGQKLASIEPDVNQAQSLATVQRSVNQAEIELNDAEKDYKAKEALLKSGLISVEVHREAETRYKAAKESLAAAQEKAALLRASGIPVGVNASQVLNITSPMDGVVINRGIELGDTVTGAGSFNAGTVIATVADLSSMIVKVGVNEVDIGKVKLEAPVTVTLDAFPKVRFSGKVARIAPAARLQDQVKVFDVEVDLESQGKELRTGMTANVTIKGDRADHVLAVPVEAVFHRDAGDVVYLRKTAAEESADEAKGNEPKATPNPKDAWKQFFDERPVVTGLASISSVQIVEGLVDGDQVALEDPTKPKKKEDER
jgi:HlyD family secretion protein